MASKTALCLLAIGITATLALKAQNLKVGFEAGSGSSYIVERVQLGMMYSPSSAMSVSLGLETTSYFELKTKLLYCNTRFTTPTFLSLPPFGPSLGEVTTFSGLSLLEHMNDSNRLNIGYNLGLGFTDETYVVNNPFLSFNDSRRQYMSIVLDGIASFKLTENPNIYTHPLLLWTDPLNTFRWSNWYSAREDLSALALLGFEYRLK